MTASIVMVGNGGSGDQQQRRRPDLQRVQPPGPHFLSSVTAAGNGNLILVGQGGVHATSPNGAEK
jgi:photosystem II stability/assembly factor-like uncharacterized protein